MKKTNGFLAVRIVLALCMVLACILWAAAQYAGGEARTVSGPEDLRVELQWAQLLSSPGEEDTVAYDAGDFVFVPDGSVEAAVFGGGLVPLTGEGGETVWPVTLFEDPLSRETVFLNAGGEEIGRLPPPEGYDIWWIANLLYPEGVLLAEVVAACDPSRVVMTTTLLPPASAVATGRRHAEAPVPSNGAFGDGAPSAGLFKSGSETSTAGTGQVSQSGAEAAETLALGCTATGAPFAGATNAPSARVRGGHARAKHTVYVDRSLGKDEWSGRIGGRGAGDDGPKRTVGTGLGALRKGERLVVGGGAYAESLDLRGRDADVRFSGSVVLARVPANRAGGGAVSAMPSFTGPTGTVTRVTN